MYCQKHASAPLSPFIAAKAASLECYGTSTAIDYERTAPNASDGSINRYYDPGTAQFLSVDPLVNLTQAPYSYAGDNPVNGSDSNGMIGDPACAGSGPIGYSPGQLAQLCAEQQANSRYIASEGCKNNPGACGNGGGFDVIANHWRGIATGV
jgi:RHS repeat-associated protein